MLSRDDFEVTEIDWRLKAVSLLAREGLRRGVKYLDVAIVPMAICLNLVVRALLWTC
jgi:hypothetical protein